MLAPHVTPEVLAPLVDVQRRRVGAASLPKVFFCMDKRQHIIGTWLLSECAKLQNTDVAYWKVDRVVLYPEPVALQKRHCTWVNTLVHLDGATELELRCRETLVGGRMLEHMPINQLHWRAWPLDDAQTQALQRHATGPFTIASPLSFCRAAGIIPEIVEYSLDWGLVCENEAMKPLRFQHFRNQFLNKKDV